MDINKEEITKGKEKHLVSKTWYSKRKKDFLKNILKNVPLTLPLFIGVKNKQTLLENKE